MPLYETIETETKMNGKWNATPMASLEPMATLRQRAEVGECGYY
jgi:hypothetical protein